MTAQRALRAIIAIAVVASPVACNRDAPGSSTATGRGRPSGRPFETAATIPAVPPLPDLSQFDASTQQRIRSEYDALGRVVAAGSAEQSADAFGRMGALLLAAESHEASKAFFEAAQTRQSRDMRWPYYLGHVALAQHQPEHAAAFFEQAHRLDPAHVPSLIRLGETYLTLGRAADAERQFAAATELQPASVAAWFQRGRARLALEDGPQAVRDLERALALDPKSDAIAYQLGLAYRAVGDHARADRYLRRRADAASVVPDDPLIDSLPGMLEGGAAYLTRGLAAMDRRDWKAAVANLQIAGERSPRDAVVHLNLGTALFLAGDRARARASFQRAIAIAPDLPKPHFTLGLVAESDGDDREAISHFETAVRLDPNYLEARASLADALRRTGQVDASLPHYLNVLSLNPAVSQARFGYAMGLVRLGRFREARDSLQDAVRLYPDQAGFMHALARLLAAAPDDSVRRGSEAVRLTDTLLASNRSWTLLETRAMAAAEVGRFDEAVRWQESAIEQARTAPAGAIAHMREVLAGYRRGVPCRTPWRADDPVFAPRPAG
jgi:tetratricopeptide (TPR) repeat protein